MFEASAESADGVASSRATRSLLAVCFFISGGAGLVYEVLWSRYLHLLFGSTTESVAVVLAMFMAGLGLGGHLIGRLADRVRSPMRLYGLLEIGVGAFALVTAPLLALARAIYGSAAAHLEPGGAGATCVKLALAALVLVPPATLMGGTLPALVRATSDSGDRARRQVGLLYALNTLGAVAGTLLSGLVLIETVGLSATMRLTAVTNLGIGLLVVARARRGDAPASEAEPASVASSFGDTLRALAASGAGRYALAGLFVSGVTTMIYEVVFTRVLGLVFGVSSYAFTLVLAVFLAGLGLGALLAAGLGRLRAPRPSDFGLAQLAAGAVGVGALAAVPWVPRLVLLARQAPELTFWQVLGAKTLIALGLLLPVALVAGVGVPLLLSVLAAGGARLGRVVGDAYMVNTAGTICGSLAAGFFLVSRLGTQGSLRAAALANLALGAVGVVAFLRRPTSDRPGPGRALAATALALGVVGALAAARASPWPPSTYLVSDTYAHPKIATSRLALENHLTMSPREIVFFEEGREATVGVLAAKEARSLLVNGHPDASDRDDMATQLMLPVVPLVAVPKPSEVMVIGFGSGVTASTALRVPGVEHVDVVELERAVLRASPFFHHVNRDVESDRRVRLVHDDARSFITSAPGRYDAIISEPSNPWRAGVANLFTVEFYRSVRAALRPGGVFAQWVQLYAISDATLRMILGTLAESFPDVQVWWLDPGNIVVLGSAAPLSFDRARVDAILDGELRDDVRRYAHFELGGEFYSRWLLDTAGVRAFVARGGAAPGEGIEANSDDQPFLEFEAPRGLFESDGQNALRLLAAKLSPAPSAAGARPGPRLHPPVEGDPPRLDLIWSGIAWMYHSAERPQEARAAMERALGVSASAFLLARAADLAAASGDLATADALLADGAQGAPPPASEAERVYIAEVTAHLRVKQHRAPEALAAFDAAGGLDGKRGVERLSVLAAIGRIDEALVQAERCLAHARLGGAIEPAEAGAIYDSLVGLAGAGADPVKVALLVEKYPGEGFPVYPRERALARLYQLAHQPAQAVMHARSALARGALDPELLQLEATALMALGRGAEAIPVEEQLRRLAPSSLYERVPSPLLESPAARR